MITANDLREGMKIEIDGNLYVVEEFQHVKRGRGGAFVRTKLRDLSTSQIIRRVFQPEEKIKDAFIEQKPAQYLYRDGDNFHFMDLETYEEKIIHKDQIPDKIPFLKDNLEVSFQIYEGKVVGIELPTFVEMKVIKAEPGLKGDTVGSATKPVVLESGYKLQVPLFIKEGDIIRLDTRTGEYIGKSQ
ncbi:elongation factor P [Candidatus Aerophobetes bacterium]|uniref:Elongation factor P n=1 Tax=Aerophobetes bacterium TaxID=2030807 RepID=A0A662DI84_UNCAE|nr:elongation factor P [Candidatus Aerophobetes bacterium]RLE15225.1 MAG: elongation factor P [Candidatus Aerophobetes bacterium]